MHDDLKQVLSAGWVLKLGWDEEHHAFKSQAVRLPKVIDERAAEPMEALAKVVVAALAITPHEPRKYSR